MKFRNRVHAGHALTEPLLAFKDKRPVVLALPRGGVPLGYEVARALEAPLDLIIVRKLGFPKHPEVALGAVVAGSKEIFLNTELFGLEKVSPAYLEQTIADKCREATDFDRVLRAHRPPINVTDRLAIIVDDGMATGATMRIAVRTLRRAKADKIIVAVPVASREAVQLLKNEADQVISLHTPSNFQAVSLYYDDFHPVTNEMVTRILDQSRRRTYDYVLN